MLYASKLSTVMVTENADSRKMASRYTLFHVKPQSAVGILRTSVRKVAALPDLRASCSLQRGQSDSIRESLCVLNGLPTRVNLTPVELNT